MSVNVIVSHPVPPPEEDVLVTMTMNLKEAKALHYLLSYATIPNALAVQGKNREKVYQLMKAFFIALDAAGVKHNWGFENDK